MFICNRLTFEESKELAKKRGLGKYITTIIKTSSEAFEEEDKYDYDRCIEYFNYEGKRIIDIYDYSKDQKQSIIQHEMSIICDSLIKILRLSH